MTSPEILSSYADVWIDVEAQIESITLTVKQILELDQSSVITLSRSAGENVEVLVGRSLIGHGEIVVAHDRAAIRIAELREED